MSLSRVLAEPSMDIAAVRKSKAKGLEAAPARSMSMVAPIVMTVAVAALVILGVQFGRTAGLVTALWGASGVAVGMWLRADRKNPVSDLTYGAMIAVGIIVGEVLVGNSVRNTLLFTAANMAEIVAAVFLVRHFIPGNPLARVGDALKMIMLLGIIAPLPGALISTLGLATAGQGDPALMFQTWWFGHALAMTNIAPLILACDARFLRSMRAPARAAESVVLFGLLCAGLWFALFQSPVNVAFVVLPLLMLITARLRIPGAVLGLVLIAVMQIASHVVRDAGAADLGAKVLLVQLNLLFAFVPFFLLAVLLNERDALNRKAQSDRLRAERASMAKSRLLANVAHEIKSPIGGVIGIGDLWRNGQLGPMTATQTEMADMLVKTARQVEALTHDLLDVARAESGELNVDIRPTDVTGVLEDIRRAVPLMPGGERVRASVHVDEDLVVLADSQRLSQVLTNLASNAVKYGGSGGVVILSAHRRGDCVRIEVTDRGPGLAPEKQGQLFEAFNRLGLERSTIEGHGVGLAITRRLVERQNGSIGVDSTPGEGATFWVELPASTPA